MSMHFVSNLSWEEAETEFQDHCPAGIHTHAFYIPEKCPTATCFYAGKLMQMSDNPGRKRPICIH
jgi:hypothetical protein